MKINHIGYVVKSLEKSAQYYCDNFNYTIKVNKIYVENQLVNIIMLKSSIKKDPDLELICPVNEKSPAFNSLKRGEVINHICYETEHYQELLKKFEKKIVRKSMPAPFELFRGGHTFFAYLNGQLTEFVEKV
jgi:hypothetical protein